MTHKPAVHHHGKVNEPLFEGRFSRLLKPREDLPGPDDLASLAATMISAARTAIPASELSSIPAGYTYLGQFIDHDLTFDPLSSLKHKNRVKSLVDFRTPRFDLDSLYGMGPDEQPFLYARNTDGSYRMLLGRVFGNLTGPPDDTTPRDIPRNVIVIASNAQPDFSLPAGRGLLGDPRNDENVIISQLTAVFLRFHNRLARDMKQDAGEESELGDVQNQVRWHYQWVVLYDFLQRVINPDTYDEILPHVKAGTSVQENPPQAPHYAHSRAATIPVEFAYAAYRFGHSMIRDEYQLNDNSAGLVGGPFAIMGRNPDGTPDLLTSLVGLRAFPDNWLIDWSFFFDRLTPSPSPNLQMALKIDTTLAPPLGDLPEGVIDSIPISLANRDLLRGFRLQLPSGQDAANALGEAVLPDSALFASRPTLAATFSGKAPLWYYVLAEAEQAPFNGNMLGPVGGRLVMETIVGLLLSDDSSILQSASEFQPRASYLNTGGQFGMPELILAAQDA
jgi:hypothetical protein